MKYFKKSVLTATIYYRETQDIIAHYKIIGDSTISTLANPQHTYTRIGNFNVTLALTSVNGCTDTLKKTNYIKIVPPKVTLKNLPDSGCAPFTKSFSSSIVTVDPVVGYSWDFGDRRGRSVRL